MSQEKLLKEMTNERRIQFLEDNAVKVDSGKYSKPLSDEEIVESKDRLTDNCIKLGDFEDELKIIKKQFKEKMEPFQIENKLILGEIRSKQRIVVGNTYHLPNYELQVMESYSESGEFLGSRRLRPDERQGGLFAIAAAQ